MRNARPSFSDAKTRLCQYKFVAYQRNQPCGVVPRHGSLCAVTAQRALQLHTPNLYQSLTHTLT